LVQVALLVLLTQPLEVLVKRQALVVFRHLVAVGDQVILVLMQPPMELQVEVALSVLP
jgi:hypothetical protein